MKTTKNIIAIFAMSALAAICGFAVGAGFSLIENVYYIRVLSESLRRSDQRGLRRLLQRAGR